MKGPNFAGAVVTLDSPDRRAEVEAFVGRPGRLSYHDACYLAFSTDGSGESPQMLADRLHAAGYKVSTLVLRS